MRNSKEIPRKSSDLSERLRHNQLKNSRERNKSKIEAEHREREREELIRN